MKAKCATASTLLQIVIIFVLTAAVAADAHENPFGDQPIVFTENQGQWDNQIRFRAAIDGATMWFSQGKAYYQFVRPLPIDDPQGQLINPGIGGAECMMISATFVGASDKAQIVGDQQVAYKCHYFLGDKKFRWKTDVPNYEAIVYRGIYPAIDLRYYGDDIEMEYDFIISPGGDIGDIRIQYDGIESLSVSEDGQLVVITAWGTIIEQAPFVYQPVGGGQEDLAGSYYLISDNTFGFAIDGDIDPNYPVVIDPVLTYSSYLGGFLGDYGWGIQPAGDGCLILVGATFSSDFPMEFPLQGTYMGEMDIFITKLDLAAGLVFSTYFGGTNREESPHTFVDDLGFIYIQGRTFSVDYPTLNAYDNDLSGNSDQFLLKLDPSGSALVFSTYLGGTEDDMSAAIYVDQYHCPYLAGITYSEDFPTVNPFQISPSQGTEDLTVTKFSADGSTLIYSTYLGGNQNEQVKTIKVDASGHAYVGGYTYSRGFPIVNAYDDSFGGYQDAFLTKFVPEGNDVVFSTFLGGDLYNEWISDLDVDAEGNIFVAGATMSADFPLVNPFQDEFKGGSVVECDGFIAKFDPSGTSLLYSTYLGGTEDDYCEAIDVDLQGIAHVTGYTYSADYPLANPLFDVLTGVPSVIVASLSAAGNELQFGTFLGGSEGDVGRTLFVDQVRNAHVTGYTLSADFPLVDPYQSVRKGTRDAFVSVIELGCCFGQTGNIDYDEQDGINGLDAVYFVFWLWKGADAPPCLDECDVDGDGSVTTGDAIYLVNFLWKSGPSPAMCSPD